MLRPVRRPPANKNAESAVLANARAIQSKFKDTAGPAMRGHGAGYHIVQDKPDVVWSTRRREFVALDDKGYLDWLSKPWAQGKQLTAATAEELAPKIRDKRSCPPHKFSDFTALDLMRQLTDEDMANVEIALDDEFSQAKSAKAGGNKPQTPLRRLWATLQTAGTVKVKVTDQLVQNGWVGLRAAIGAERATEIATALSITEPA
jgi:hypothetical protein